MTQITKQIDELTSETYIFSTHAMDSNKPILYLDKYWVSVKESKRHKPRIVSNYSRLSSRDSSLTEDQVPLTDELKKEAIQLYISNIQVCKWSERNKS